MPFEEWAEEWLTPAVRPKPGTRAGCRVHPAPPGASPILVAGYTGLPAGEIGALRAGRVDLVRETLTVHESLAEVKGKLIFGPTPGP
jgi:hypothetical protein